MSIFYDQKGKDIVFRALVNRPLGDCKIEDLGPIAIDYLRWFMEDNKNDVINQRIRMRKFLQEHKNDPSVQFDRQSFEEPFIAENLFRDAIGRKCKEVAVCKKNIEYRMDISLMEFFENHPQSQEMKDLVALMQDNDVYGLDDISLNVFVYRLGKYSYIAVHPLAVYLKRD